MPDAADVFITLLEIPPQNFCFGNGQAQFADRLPATWWRAAGVRAASTSGDLPPPTRRHRHQRRMARRCNP
jgi:hypothetical protein